MDTPRTLIEAVKYFANPDNCREYLVARRWPNGVTCPTCGSSDIYFDKTRQGWICKTRHPRRKFSLKTGTIFEDSPLGLDKWLPTVWMIANCKNGVSSWEIHRAIGVTQKTAWFMLHRVRLTMQDEKEGLLCGEVEADETFIGGKARNMHANKRRERVKGRGPAGKTIVAAVLERGGEIRATVVEKRRKQELQAHVRENVAPCSTVCTDELLSYDGLSKDFKHQVINHAIAYVDERVHTNGCENFWSLLKRGLNGTYVSSEPFHLFRYIDEQAFRFNNRKEMNDADRFSEVIRNIVGRRLTYAELIGALAPASPA